MIYSFGNYTERHKSLRIHTQHSACLTRYGSYIINDLKDEYVIYYDAVYNKRHAQTVCLLFCVL